MKYVRVYTDLDDESHFEDVEVELTLADFVPPSTPFVCFCINAGDLTGSTIQKFILRHP